MTSDSAFQVLNPPAITSVKYRHNFIKTAVCEVRFPTLLELEQAPPRVFQARIRKLYPYYEAQLLEQVGAPDGIFQEPSYLFRSKDRYWTVTMKSASLALETSHYSTFEEFYERFAYILECAKDIIDSDFFTRVGLRYINFVPIEGGSVEGWIRNELIAPLLTNAIGSTKNYAALIHGYLERGEYTMRHGMKLPADSGATPSETYTLDFDYFRENVELAEVKELLAYFHEKNFAFFHWSLGDKAKEKLGEGIAK